MAILYALVARGKTVLAEFTVRRTAKKRRTRKGVAASGDVHVHSVAHPLPLFLPLVLGTQIISQSTSGNFPTVTRFLLARIGDRGMPHGGGEAGYVHGKRYMYVSVSDCEMGHASAYWCACQGLLYHICSLSPAPFASGACIFNNT